MVMRVFEDVAVPPCGVEQLGFMPGINLVAQAATYTSTTFVPGRSCSPHGLQQFRAGTNAVGSRRKCSSNRYSRVESSMVSSHAGPDA